MARPRLTEKERERLFWRSVDITDSCWLWTAYRTPAGYGAIRYQGRDIGAHRYCYELLIDKIPEKMHLDHLCRVPACVNPQHLEVVTCRENTVRGNVTINKKSKLPIGVVKNRQGRFVARKHFNGKQWHIAIFNDPEEAHIAYETAILV